ncbi:MAG: hypothetical protein OEZ06_30915 [Myxococcales bacterium]|nr:hypothetical protein [Myxococcales bacterium]
MDAEPADAEPDADLEALAASLTPEEPEALPPPPPPSGFDMGALASPSRPPPQRQPGPIVKTATRAST